MKNNECIISDADGTCKETGARYKAIYHCANTRYRDANSLSYHYAQRAMTRGGWHDEEEEKRSRDGEKETREGRGFILLEMQRYAALTPHTPPPADRNVPVFFIDNRRYARALHLSFLRYLEKNSGRLLLDVSTVTFHIEPRVSLCGRNGIESDTSEWIFRRNFASRGRATKKSRLVVRFG